MLNKLVFKKNALVPSINVYIFCIVATKKLSSCKLAVFHLYSILIQCTVECLKKSADFKVIAVCKNYPYMFCWKSVLFGNHGYINAGNHGWINAGNHGLQSSSYCLCTVHRTHLQQYTTFIVIKKVYQSSSYRLCTVHRTHLQQYITFIVTKKVLQSSSYCLCTVHAIRSFATTFTYAN